MQRQLPAMDEWAKSTFLHGQVSKMRIIETFGGTALRQSRDLGKNPVAMGFTSYSAACI